MATVVDRLSQHGVSRTTQVRTEGERLRDLERIKAYRDLDGQIRTQAASWSYGPALFQLTTELLRLNPEHYTTWNIRRRCLTLALLTKKANQEGPESQAEASDLDGQASDVSVLKSELAFTIPLLIKFPKCYWIWGFRQWILSQAVLRLTVPVAREIWEVELGLTSAMLDRDQRNFHAWDYRRIVVAKLESPQLRGKSMAKDEFAYTTRMIRLNLSNFSAWHNRSQLIPRLLDERGANDETRAAFLLKELSYVGEGLNVDPGDQSLWYYHQFLMLQMVGGGDRPTIVGNMDLREKVLHVSHEIDEIKDLLEDYPSTKWIYEVLLEYTLALMGLEQGTVPRDGELGDLQNWLTKLRTLDPMRMGRWDDVERQISLSRS
ncbi:Rab geranylgeranyltransferase [Amphichorda felina]